MSKRFDTIVLGAGINGCAIARRLSLQGNKVALIERNTIGCGTSSNSSKLIHGGLRYLETGQFGLVRESLRDRKRLYEMYPDLVEMVPFYLPIYDDSPRPWWVINAGLVLYDLLSWPGKQGDSPSAVYGKGNGLQQGQSPCFPKTEFRHRRVGNEEFLKRFPGVNEDGLRRVYVYYDGKTDDLELTRRLAGDARECECVVKENCEIEEISVEVNRVRVSCSDSEGEQVLEAPLLVNAAGPWIDEVNDRYGLPHNYRISKVSGIHIVINKKLVPECMFLQTVSRRIFFMIPWKEDATIIGTTERMEDGSCDQVAVREEDINYLLDCANGYLKKPISRPDIADTFLGIRPLVRGRDEVDATSMSRDYKIDIVKMAGATLVHVYGGKLTTCLSMAEKVEKAMTYGV
ncbi:MAG: glycerol-3-phosphate dehydrogenase/oxidase [Syntrophomonas sp.]